MILIQNVTYKNDLLVNTKATERWNNMSFVWFIEMKDKRLGRVTTTSGTMSRDKQSQKRWVGLSAGLRRSAASPSPLCSTFQPSGSYLYWLRTGRIAEDSWWNSDTHRWPVRNDDGQCSKDARNSWRKAVGRQNEPWRALFCVHVTRTEEILVWGGGGVGGG